MRERADLCRFNAYNTRNVFDEASWQDLADDWTKLAEAFERLSGPKCNPWAVVLWPALKSFSGHGPRGNRLAPPSQRPPQVTEMFEYRAYLIGRDGKVIHRVDMLCDDDEAAKARAQLLIDIHIVELGQGTRDSPHHALWSGFLNVASQRNWPQLRGWSSWGHSLR